MCLLQTLSSCSVDVMWSLCSSDQSLELQCHGPSHVNFPTVGQWNIFSYLIHPPDSLTGTDELSVLIHSPCMTYTAASHQGKADMFWLWGCYDVHLYTVSRYNMQYGSQAGIKPGVVVMLCSITIQLSKHPILNSVTTAFSLMCKTE